MDFEPGHLNSSHTDASSGNMSSNASQPATSSCSTVRMTFHYFLPTGISSVKSSNNDASERYDAITNTPTRREGTR